MRGRERRAGWGPRGGGVRERGGGAYSLSRGWNMGCLVPGKRVHSLTFTPESPSQPFHRPKPQRLLFIEDLHEDIYFMSWSVSTTPRGRCYYALCNLPGFADPLKSLKVALEMSTSRPFHQERVAGAYSQARPGTCWLRLPASSRLPPTLPSGNPPPELEQSASNLAPPP